MDILGGVTGLYLPLSCKPFVMSGNTVTIACESASSGHRVFAARREERQRKRQL